MESRAPSTSLCQHKETRLSLEPLPTSSIIQLQLPTTNAFGRTTRVSRKVLSSVATCQNEPDFKKRHIASASSIFFRDLSRYPRAILWRVLDGNTTLELRSTDLYRGKSDSREATYIIRLVFPNTIRTGGVALADPAGEDSFNVFVLTKGNDLYTFTLKPTFFSQSSASEEDFERWCKNFRPSSLTISNSHKLIATGPYELLVALGDGRLARLTRKKGEDGTQWAEAAYHDGQWGSSLRGLIRWQGNHSVRFEGLSLDQNTSVAACTSPDLQHIFSVSLNHTLRIWNISTGTQSISRDLLDIPREPQDAAKIMLNPAIAAPLQIFNSHSSGGYKYFAVTFSPLSSGLFKFWGVRDADHDENGIRDLFPEEPLKLPDPDDEALWTLADFALKSSIETAEVDIWILLRLNKRYKLYHRKFPELQNIGEDWEFGWTTVAVDTVRQEPLNRPPLFVSDFDSEDISSRWLEYLLTPERVPVAVLEAAISTYAQTRDVPIQRSSKLTLKEKLSSIVSSRVRFHQNSQDTSIQNSVIKFRKDIQAEWMNFWNIILDIEQYRWEPMSLSLDLQSDIPWVVLTDGFSAIRTCTDLEVLADNKPDDLFSNPRTIAQSIESEGISMTRLQWDELARVLEAAGKFRNSFSENLRISCENKLTEELWTSPSHSIPARIQLFYDQCDFSSGVTDRQYNDLANSLKELGGFDGLSTEYFLAIIATLTAESLTSRELQPTAFGRKILVRGAQDMIAVQSRILTDLLYLTVFIEIDIDRDEHPMADFNAALVYHALLERLRPVRLCHWVANSRGSITQGNKPVSGDSEIGKLPETSLSVNSTVAATFFAKYIFYQSHSTQTQSLALTNSIRDLLAYTSGTYGGDTLSLDNVLISIQCNLLKNGYVELATEFQLFQPETAWATYIRARLCLLKQEYSQAAIYFKQAAFKMSRSKPTSKEYIDRSFSLLDPVAGQLLASGLSNYYTHITNLFATLRIHVQIIAFSKLALQHCSLISSPEQYSDLLSRLFHSSLAIIDYSTAYSALVRYTDRALQRSALASLVSDMAAQDAIDELLRFPFPTMQKEVDSWLVEKARSETQSQGRPGATPFFKILYAWRLRQGDFRGAAAVLVERLDLKGQTRGRNGKFGVKDAETSLDEYLVGINALALVGGEDDGWVFVEGDEGKRKVVRLEDLRETYEKEMDRVGMLELGKFGILGDDDDDVDMDG